MGKTRHMLEPCGRWRGFSRVVLELVRHFRQILVCKRQPLFAVRSSGVPDLLGTNPTGVWYSMTKTFTLATWITDLQKYRFDFWSTTIQISPKVSEICSRCTTMRRILPKLKDLLHEKSSYVVIKPLKGAHITNILDEKVARMCPLLSLWAAYYTNANYGCIMYAYRLRVL